MARNKEAATQSPLFAGFPTLPTCMTIPSGQRFARKMGHSSAIPYTTWTKNSKPVSLQQLTKSFDGPGKKRSIEDVTAEVIRKNPGLRTEFERCFSQEFDLAVERGIKRGFESARFTSHKPKAEDVSAAVCEELDRCGGNGT